MPTDTHGPNEKSSDKENSKQIGTSVGKNPPSITQSQIEKAGNSKGEARTQENNRAFEKVNTVTMSVFTGIMILIMFYQSCQTRESLSLTRHALKQSEEASAQSAKDVQDSLAIAQRSTDAAERLAANVEASLGFARENARQEQRPWVGISERHGGITADRGNIFTFYFTNVGKTPAIDVYPTMRIFHQPKNSSDPFLKDTYPKKGMVVLPGARYYVSRDGPKLSDSEVEQVRSDNWRVYVLGIIWYRDGIGLTHRTRFCGRLVLDESGNQRFTPCGFHDDAN